jgi:hypothetical protein
VRQNLEPEGITWQQGQIDSKGFSMNEWLPVVVGFSFIVVVVALLALFRDSDWAQDLTRLRGLRGTGEGGLVLPRDVGRMALYTFLIALLLFGAAYGAFMVSERFPNESKGNLVASAYFFVLFVLSAVAMAYAAILSVTAGVAGWRTGKAARQLERNGISSMTDATKSAADSVPDRAPIGVRIAGTLAGVVGVLTLLSAIAVGIPILDESGSALTLVVGSVAGLAALVAAGLIWRARKLGVLVLALAWAVPTAAAIIVGEAASGNLLLTASLLLSAANWKALR